MYNFDKYIDEGFENREDYLNSLALDYGLSYDIVLSIADSLGEEEDFDSLIDELDEYVEYLSFNEDDCLDCENYNDCFGDLIPIEDDIDLN